MDDPGIQRELTREIQASPYLAIRRLSCEVHEGVASLSGEVPNFHTRQIAIQLAQAVAGVRSVNDGLKVMHDKSKPK